MNAATGFIESIKSLVRKITVAYISLGEIDTSLERVVSIINIMMLLILFLNLFENFQSFFR